MAHPGDPSVEVKHLRSAAIARVLSDPACAAALATAARARVAGRYRLADTIARTADVYRELELA